MYIGKPIYVIKEDKFHYVEYFETEHELYLPYGDPPFTWQASQLNDIHFLNHKYILQIQDHLIDNQYKNQNNLLNYV